MVAGNGMVAKCFDSYRSDNHFLIFASGVSNSKSTHPEDFGREMGMIAEAIENNPGKTFVYFSTTSINDPSESNSAYVRHKIQAEQFIASHASDYLIFRVSNLVGRSANPNTVLNFFVNSIKANTPFNLWMHACRNLIDVDDFFKIVDYILQHRLFSNSTVNIANKQNYPAPVIVAAIEEHLHQKANCILLPKGSDFNIDISQVLPVIQATGISFDEHYLTKLVSKYY
jgi:nucleoside-diphosphate-sugar epimerase